MHRPVRLQLEILEQRDCPSAFGTAWLDEANLTISFAPDGTDVYQTASNFSELFGTSSDAAKLEILTAFQTWAIHSNINLGLVADGGQSFEIGGAVQGDARFGDIRIGTSALPDQLLASTSPFSYLSPVYAGNVVLNGGQSFAVAGGGGAYDLYTTMLQEAGHALGLDNSTSIASVMYEYYRSAQAGLSAGDIAAIQALYGERVADAYDLKDSNGTIAAATDYRATLRADLTTTLDVDYYMFETTCRDASIAIDLKASGISLLTARMSIYNQKGTLLASTFTSDPLRNDLTLTFKGKPGNKYFVRVESADSSVFGVGAYQLTIQGDNYNHENARVNATGNHVPEGSTIELKSETDYRISSSIDSATDDDEFKVKIPENLGASPTLIATVWSQTAALTDLQITVRNSDGEIVAAQVLTRSDGVTTVQIRDVIPNKDYYIHVCSPSGQVGDYSLSLDMRAEAIESPLQASGTLGGEAAASTYGYMNVLHDQVMHFVLDSQTANAAPGTVVNVTIRDAANQVVGEVSAAAGQARSFDVFLRTGIYRVQITVTSSDGSTPTTTNFTLAGTRISDPISVVPTDPTASPTPSSDSTATTTDEAPPPDASAPPDQMTEDDLTFVPPPPDEWVWSYWWSPLPSDAGLWY